MSTAKAMSDRQIAVEANRIRAGLRTLVRIAGYLVPDGLAKKLSTSELALLGTSLSALGQMEDLEQLRRSLEQLPDISARARRKP